MILPWKMVFLEALHHSSIAGVQFFLSKQKGRGHLRSLRRRTCQSFTCSLAKQYSWEWGCLLSQQRSHAVPVTVSTQPLPWFPPRRTKEQEHGAVTIWQNQVLVTQNRASFFVNRGVWYRRASVAGKQGERSACLGVQCALECPAVWRTMMAWWTTTTMVFALSVWLCKIVHSGWKETVGL